MAELQQICATCFWLIPLAAEACPYCGADLEVLSARDYSEKLISALCHPISEVRMRAIIALGWRKEEYAAQPLLTLALKHPVDIVEGIAVAECLEKLGADGEAALVKLAEQHPAHTVRETAAAALHKRKIKNERL